MSYTVHLSVTFKGTASKDEAEDIAEGLRDHVYETFNDDDSIQQIQTRVRVHND